MFATKTLVQMYAFNKKSTISTHNYVMVHIETDAKKDYWLKDWENNKNLQADIQAFFTNCGFLLMVYFVRLSQYSYSLLERNT